MHLYSDGGLDISLDGTYLLVCSILYHRPDFRLDLKELGFSPGTSARHGLDEVSELVSGISGLTLNDKGAIMEKLMNVFYVFKNNHNNNVGLRRFRFKGPYSC